MSTLKKLIDLFTPTELRRLVALIGMILVMATLDMLGVASVLPFIALLANPQLLETNSFLRTTFELTEEIGLQSEQDFLFALGILVLLLFVISLAFKALTTYYQTRFALLQEYSIGKRLMKGYLHQPYIWFLNRHSADLSKTVLSEINVVIGSGVIPLMILMAQGGVSIALLVLLIVVDAKLAISVSLVLGLSYFFIFQLMRVWLKRLGQARMRVNKERFKAISDAFGAAKEIKVGGFEKVYIERFAVPAEIYASVQASANIIAQLPRFVLEAISFGGMLILIIYLMATHHGSLEAALPVIVLYAFAGYRLMPALQQIYVAFTQLQFVGPALNALHEDLINLGANDDYVEKIWPMQLTKAIMLNKVVYSYPNSVQYALKGIDLIIPAHSKVGLVGTTGSGKTTTVDVILGLLHPQVGTLTVDGRVINHSNIRDWQKAIGYVPQQINLLDESVAANIAFGTDLLDIDMEAVKRASKIANLDQFVTNSLPDGYATIVGERGVRLSGGQRQRIGIARALYHSPQVLILDEATSALDNVTEQVVMDAINNLGCEITIILIAHRLSTIRQCDQIYILDKGEIVASGTYNELKDKSKHFASMLKTNATEFISTVI